MPVPTSSSRARDFTEDSVIFKNRKKVIIASDDEEEDEEEKEEEQSTLSVTEDTDEAERTYPGNQ